MFVCFLNYFRGILNCFIERDGGKKKMHLVKSGEFRVSHLSDDNTAKAFLVKCLSCNW